MGLLLREDLLKKEVLKIEKVDLGDGNYVNVREMTGLERDEWDRSLIDVDVDKSGKPVYKQNLSNYKARLAVLTVCDDDGKPVFDKTDAMKLANAIGAFNLNKIATAASELNGISEKEKEDILKNSEAVQDGDSSSDSVEN